MQSYNLLAPLIAAGVIALVGLVLLLWMNSSEPQLARPEEEAHDPFDDENPVSADRRPHFASYTLWQIADEVLKRRASKRPAETIPTETNVSYARPTKAEVHTS